MFCFVIKSDNLDRLKSKVVEQQHGVDRLRDAVKAVDDQLRDLENDDDKV